MPNEEYQRLLRADARGAAPAHRGRRRRPRRRRAAGDLPRPRRPRPRRPARRLPPGGRGPRPPERSIFAYTIKGWSLPTMGHPANHSALLNHAQYAELAAKLGEDPDDPFKPFEPGSPEARAVRGDRAAGSSAAPRAPSPPRRSRTTSAASTPARPRPSRRSGASSSTSCARRRRWPTRVVTVSPDVGTSTNLGGWINKAGIWSAGDRIDWFADDTDTLVRWRESDHGQHIELGHRRGQPRRRARASSGATWSRDGQPLLPVGTIYDPFVSRALEPWSFGIYAGGQSILVGTPSGVTLGPEGGAHQSVITPSIGIEQPGCVAYEPAFGQDFEWCFLHALSQLGKPGGTSAYFRLSTRPIDQALHTGTREGALAGGYKLRPHDAPDVVIAVMGALVPEAIAAADTLDRGRGPRRRGRLRHLRRPAVPLLPGPLRPRRRGREHAREAVPQGRPDRQPASTATRTRSASWARRSPASACRASARPATSPSSTSTTRSTPSRSSAPRSTYSVETRAASVSRVS